MKRMVIGGFIAAFAAYFLWTLTGDNIMYGAVVLTIIFLVGISLFIWGKGARRKARKKVVD